MMEMKRTQRQELISFFLAVLLLVISGSGSSSPQMGETNSRSVGASSDANPTDSLTITNGGGEENVGVTVQNWRGLATKDDESHPIRLNVETIRTVDPAEARRLLALNISLEEVRSQARAGDRDAILRGSIRLNDDSYRLIDITLASSGNRSTLEASLASSRSRSGSEDAASIVGNIVGNIVVTIPEADDIRAVEGYAVINDSKYSGTYSLLLNECFGPGPRAGKLGREQ
jgi:hypothetical protein